MNITLTRKPLWKRRLQYPKVFYGHYKICRRTSSRLWALKEAYWLSELIWRK